MLLTGLLLVLGGVGTIPRSAAAAAFSKLLVSVAGPPCFGVTFFVATTAASASSPSEEASFLLTVVTRGLVVRNDLLAGEASVVAGEESTSATAVESHRWSTESIVWCSSGDSSSCIGNVGSGD